MFSLSKRQVRAALTGAAAAATYLAAAEIGSKRPVKLGALFFLSSAALAGVVGQVASSRASVKATVTEARLNNLLLNGGQFGGDIVVNGNHTVNGHHTVNGDADIHGKMDMHGSTGNPCLDNISEINKGAGGTFGAWGNFFTNNHDIHLGTGSVGP